MDGGDQTEKALLASEQLACAQVKALKGTLDALAAETSSERLVEHILRTTAEQFGAHSLSIWSRDESSEMIGLEYAFEGNALIRKTDPRFAGMPRWLPMEDIWPWPEVFRTGKPSIIDDIREVPPFPLRDRLLPMGIVTVFLVPMMMAGKLEGALGIRFLRRRAFAADEVELAQALATQALLMIQFGRLSEQSREAAIIAERNRLARDIHDTLAQGFTGIIIQLEAAEDALARGLSQEAGGHLRRAGSLARESLTEARRSVHALRPEALDGSSVGDALESLLRRMTEGTGVTTDFRVIGEPRSLPVEWDESLFRIGQEVLTNVLRHAKADHLTSRLIYSIDEVRLDMRDDGVGFDPAAVAAAGGQGLAGIKERVDEMYGLLDVRSAPGHGSTIIVSVPLARSPLLAPAR